MEVKTLNNGNVQILKESNRDFSDYLRIHRLD